MTSPVNPPKSVTAMLAVPELPQNDRSGSAALELPVRTDAESRRVDLEGKGGGRGQGSGDAGDGRKMYEPRVAELLTFSVSTLVALAGFVPKDAVTPPGRAGNRQSLRCR